MAFLQSEPRRSLVNAADMVSILLVNEIGQSLMDLSPPRAIRWSQVRSLHGSSSFPEEIGNRGTGWMQTPCVGYLRGRRASLAGVIAQLEGPGVAQVAVGTVAAEENRLPGWGVIGHGRMGPRGWPGDVQLHPRVTVRVIDPRISQYALVRATPRRRGTHLGLSPKEHELPSERNQGGSYAGSGERSRRGQLRPHVGGRVVRPKIPEHAVAQTAEEVGTLVDWVVDKRSLRSGWRLRSRRANPGPVGLLRVEGPQVVPGGIPAKQERPPVTLQVRHGVTIYAI